MGALFFLGSKFWVGVAVEAVVETGHPLVISDVDTFGATAFAPLSFVFLQGAGLRGKGGKEFSIYAVCLVDPGNGKEIIGTAGI